MDVYAAGLRELGACAGVVYNNDRVELATRLLREIHLVDGADKTVIVPRETVLFSPVFVFKEENGSNISIYPGKAELFSTEPSYPTNL